MSGPAAIRSAIVAAGILCTAGLTNSVAAAPLIPGTISVASTGIAETMQVRWRGQGGGGAGLATGLMTGLIIGGLVAAPHYYEEPRYVGPIGYARQTGRVARTIVDSSENFARDIQR